MLYDFLKRSEGLFGVMAVITLPVLVMLGGATLTTGSAIVEKNNAQNSADLAVLSANATFRNSAFNGMTEAKAELRAKKVAQSVNDFNLNRKNSQNQTTFAKNGDTFVVNNANVVEAILLDSSKDFNFNVVAKTDDGFRSINGGNRINNTSSEVAFAFDESFSMSLPVRDQSGNVVGTAASSLRQSVRLALDALFDNLTAEEERQFAYMQLMYHRVLGFRTNSSNWLADKAKNLDDFTNGYNAAFDNDATNIRLAVHHAHELINRFDPIVKKPTHNEVMVLMSDGVPTATFIESNRTLRPVCSTKMIAVPVEDGVCTIDGVGGKTKCKVNYSCKNGIIKWVNVENVDGIETLTWEHVENIDDYEAFLKAEKPRILELCDKFKKQQGVGKRYIFSVFFNTNNEHIDYGKDLMQRCASKGKDHYFYYVENSTQLEKAYLNIVASIKKLSGTDDRIEYQKIKITQ